MERILNLKNNVKIKKSTVVVTGVCMSIPFFIINFILSNTNFIY